MTEKADLLKEIADRLTPKCPKCGSKNVKVYGIGGTQSCFGGYGVIDVDVDIAHCQKCHTEWSL